MPFLTHQDFHPEGALTIGLWLRDRIPVVTAMLVQLTAVSVYSTDLILSPPHTHTPLPSCTLLPSLQIRGLCPRACPLQPALKLLFLTCLPRPLLSRCCRPRCCQSTPVPPWSVLPLPRHVARPVFQIQGPCPYPPCLPLSPHVELFPCLYLLFICQPVPPPRARPSSLSTKPFLNSQP